MNSPSFQVVADLLARRTGQQLTESRRWRVSTALSRVFRERGISNVDQLACMLANPADPKLEEEVVEALLNNETYFFRDRPTFEQLPEEIFPLLAERRAEQRRIQIWCAGCSTGQEAHSLAIQFAEQGDRWSGWSIDILGTDISPQVIRAARGGIYSQFEIQRGLTVQQMLTHFDETPDGWQIRSPTRCTTRFEQHNVLDQAPRKHAFDLILCRNVLLYFDPRTRRFAFNRLRAALADDGFLMLGAGETVVGQTESFAPTVHPSIYVAERQPAAVSPAMAG